MPAFPESTLRGLFERALEEEIGIAVYTNDTNFLSQKLYDFRAKHGVDPDKIIGFIRLPDRLAMVKKTVELDA